MTYGQTGPHQTKEAAIGPSWGHEKSQDILRDILGGRPQQEKASITPQSQVLALSWLQKYQLQSFPSLLEVLKP